MTYTLASLSPKHAYEDQYKLKRKSEAKMVIQQCEAIVTMQKYIQEWLVRQTCIYEIIIIYYFHTMLLEASVSKKKTPKASIKG